jgi:pimeloyl-ACP methyl ester carboxylesterase
VPLLAGRYRLIMPDLRGFGWSQAPLRGYRTDARVEEVLALLDALGLDRVRLVGHNMGGWLGFMACLRAPHRFDGFLALNITHPWPRQSNVLRGLWRMWFTAFLEYPLLGEAVVRHWPAFVRFLMRRAVVEPGTWNRADLDDFTERLRPIRRAHASRALFWQFVWWDIPRLAFGRYNRLRLRVPTLILAGADDPEIAPRTLAPRPDHADQVRYQLVENAGHYLHEERPGLVADTAVTFFTHERWPEVVADTAVMFFTDARDRAV